MAPSQVCPDEPLAEPLATMPCSFSYLLTEYRPLSSNSDQICYAHCVGCWLQAFVFEETAKRSEARGGGHSGTFSAGCPEAVGGARGSGNPAVSARTGE